jgi:predicted ATPase
MITELKIENYKSIQDLTLEVGRVNVLIGENGCGKSNILEAITFAAAAEANKLDNEFLVNRGIRVTKPELMRSAFDNINYNKEIRIKVTLSKNIKFGSILKNDNQVYSKWLCDNTLQNAIDKSDDINNAIKLIEEQFVINENMFDMFYKSENYEKLCKEKEIFNELKPTIDGFKDALKLMNNFIIFSPENTSLRNLEKEGQIQPLGINGEGLFKLLTVIQNEAKQSKDFRELDDIQETLELFGWFENIEIPDDYSQLEKKITIKDRYLEIPFDQRSANEGFLLVLFYITLVVSKYTPKIFAIDNIDTSLNPKLCTKLIKELARLAKKYDKQLFVTSHNPAILDGIDLGDDEQRLFVVSRNKQGHTHCKRIEVTDKPKSSVRDMLSRLFNDNKTYNKEDILNTFDNGDDPLDISYAFSKMFNDNEVYSKEDILNKFDNSEEPVKLSYAFLRGYIGGLPKNF